MLDNGHISYIDHAHNTHIQAALSTRQTMSHGVASADIVFAAQGDYKGLPLTASGSGGSVLALSDETTPYPLNIKATLGHTHLHAVGTVTSLTRFRAVDLNMTLSGASLDHLYPLIGIALPRTPVYLTKGHLLHNAQQWRYEKFTGRVGKSDVAGNMQVDSSGKRPFLRGNLTFQMLDLADLSRRVAWVDADEAKKGKKPLTVPLSDDAIEVLRGQIGQSHEWMFPYRGKPVSEIKTAWAAAVKKSGIKPVRWHDLRHTWASWHLMAGTPIEVLQKLGGWADLKMVLVYAHLAPDHLASYVNNSKPRNLDAVA